MFRKLLIMVIALSISAMAASPAKALNGTLLYLLINGGRSVTCESIVKSSNIELPGELVYECEIVPLLAYWECVNPSDLTPRAQGEVYDYTVSFSQTVGVDPINFAGKQKTLTGSYFSSQFISDELELYCVNPLWSVVLESVRLNLLDATAYLYECEVYDYDNSTCLQSSTEPISYIEATGCVPGDPDPDTGYYDYSCESYNIVK